MWSTIDRLISDEAMRARLAEASKSMQAAKGTEKAARIIAQIATKAA